MLLFNNQIRIHLIRVAAIPAVANFRWPIACGAISRLTIVAFSDAGTFNSRFGHKRAKKEKNSRDNLHSLNLCVIKSMGIDRSPYLYPKAWTYSSETRLD